MKVPAPPRQIRFGAAARAMKALLQDPDDTAQVFRIIEALSGRNGERTLDRLKSTPSGKRLLNRDQAIQSPPAVTAPVPAVPRRARAVRAGEFRYKVTNSNAPPRCGSPG